MWEEKATAVARLSCQPSQRFVSGTGLSFQARLLLAQSQRNWPGMNHPWKCSMLQRFPQWPEEPSPAHCKAAFRNQEAELVAWCFGVCRVKAASRPRSSSFSSTEYALITSAHVWASEVLQLLEAVLYYFAVNY